MNLATAAMRADSEADAGRWVCSPGTSEIAYRASKVCFMTPGATCARAV